MPSLKAIRARLSSVKSTKKITSAMKMVATSKLRQTQDLLMKTAPYAQGVQLSLAKILNDIGPNQELPSLLVAKGPGAKHLYIVISSERGLCGNFNMLVAGASLRRLFTHPDASFYFVGRKAFEYIKRLHGSCVLGHQSNTGHEGYKGAEDLADYLLDMHDQGVFDRCSVIYTRFVTTMTSSIEDMPLIPFAPDLVDDVAAIRKPLYGFEPMDDAYLKTIARQSIIASLYFAIVSSKAAEESARMMAMDNATQNAKDMIDHLQLLFNRTRQAQITRELIEIVSGASAV